MPPHNRKSHPSHPLIPTEPYHPSPSPSTYRDILIFEERIKQAAARYTRRKRKYQTLLTFLLAATLTSAYNAAANSPQWSGIVDLALRWAADPDTDYRTGLGNELQHHFRVRKAGGAAAAGGRRGATDEGLSGVRGAFANRRRGGGGGAAAAAAAASKVKGVVWDIADAGSAAASAAVSAATAAALSTTHSPPPTTTPSSADATLKQNKGKARAFHFRTGTPSDSPLISSISSKTAAAAYSTSPQTSPTTTIAQEHEQQAAYYADGAAMLRYYLWVGLFLFFSTTTFLFFASGLYSERIAAGATFVPQANRALRHYHLYLNTRTGAGAVEDEKRVGGAGGSSRPALSRATSWIWWPPSSSTTPDPPSEKEKPSTKKKGRFSDRDPMDDDPIVTRAPSTPLRRPTTPTSTNQPPPSSNPRGELLLGPRVHPEFRAGYERYRDEFERRRAMRIEAQRKGRGFGSRAWRAVRSWVGLGVGSG
ncbi:hypothetical protein A4X09_0g6085 [Tilletia walkeri]|uniref:Transmembrane protein 188 n=1 Tax=Tilletia walkeri TaxID=117179 RepID=A0A8X7T305_9BASI|nr:hypothetical protein A4X09_0g6085 [Tilletia walkeri]